MKLPDDQTVQLTTVRLIPPGLPRTLRGGTTGVVVEDGGIKLDDVDGIHFQLVEPDAFEPGTEVHVRRANGREWAVPVEVLDRHRYEQRAQQHLKARARRQQRAREQAAAARFWAQYDLPFEWDVARKGRRSELLEGSTGTGVTERTVEHLYVQSPVSDGRLERAADSYLCDDSATFRFDEGVRKSGPDGDPFVPPVTCQACLDLMDRWRRDDGESQPES